MFGLRGEPVRVGRRVLSQCAVSGTGVRFVTSRIRSRERRRPVVPRRAAGECGIRSAGLRIRSSGRRRSVEYPRALSGRGVRGVRRRVGPHWRRPAAHPCVLSGSDALVPGSRGQARVRSTRAFSRERSPAGGSARTARTVACHRIGTGRPAPGQPRPGRAKTARNEPNVSSRAPPRCRQVRDPRSFPAAAFVRAAVVSHAIRG